MINKKLYSLALLAGLIILTISCSVTNDVQDISICDYPLYPSEDTVIASHNEWTQSHYKLRISAFKQDSIYSNSIVMLGNSLTEQGGNWGERLKKERVKNRGISGDNTTGVLARLGEIKCAEPTQVFVMIGTNDLWTNHSVEQVSANIDRIGNELAISLPETEVYIQTIMPLEEGHDKTERLMNINDLLRSVQNPPYTLIDTFGKMSENNDYMPSSYTTDGVHLTHAGYNKWVSILNLYLK